MMIDQIIKITISIPLMFLGCRGIVNVYEKIKKKLERLIKRKIE